jgi:Integrase zinc binding domain
VQVSLDQEWLINLNHCDSYLGHQGVDQTAYSLKEFHKWKTMRVYVSEFIKKCDL